MTPKTDNALLQTSLEKNEKKAIQYLQQVKLFLKHNQKHQNNRSSKQKTSRLVVQSGKT